jgi:hypothetical protein
MIDIRNAEIVKYDDNWDITIYFDAEEGAKKFYIVPLPHLVMATTGDLPVFSLTKYKSNEGNIKGLCTFDVELYVPKNAYDAVKQYLEARGKGDFVQGQFDWASVNTYFYFALTDQKVINMVPSMYAQNRVSFVIPLESNKDVEIFISAFNTNQGATSPFRIEYDMTCLTKLKGIEATVTYEASVAVEWENKYKTEKDTWGNSRTVVAEIKKNLKQSKAGKVFIDPKDIISEEARQRAEEWAWVTLEKMVADAVIIANAAATSPNPIESTASFEQFYKESQVIEWAVKGSDNLPKFSDEEWARLYQEVDLRQLAVNFNLNGNFGTNDDSNIDRVDVTVMYRGMETVTQSLSPTGTQSSFIYKAPGYFEDGIYIDTYQYKYAIYFKDAKEQPYVSETYKSSDTIVSITPPALGIQSISFTCTNIPFKTYKDAFQVDGLLTVDRLIIDFYYNRPAGQPNKTEQKEVMTNGTAVTFKSVYNLPIENSYIYRLTYLMTNGEQVIVDPVRNFGANNSNTVLINYPMQEITFSVNARKDGERPLEFVTLDTEYIDEQNPGWWPSKSFEPWETIFKSSFIVNPEKWKFDAIRNPDGAYYKLNGLLMYKTGESLPINNYLVPSNKSSFTIFTDKEQASVAIDYSMVDWTKVFKVEVTLFQTEGETLSAERVKHILHPQSLEDVAGVSELNKQSYPVVEKDNPKRKLLYNVTRDFDYPKFEYWMAVVYYQIIGEPLYLKARKTDNLLYTLPPNGDTPEQHISFMSVKMENSSFMKKPEQTEDTHFEG